MNAGGTRWVPILVLVTCCYGANGQERLSVDVEIDGHEAKLAFDTGCNVPLAIFQPSAHRFGLETTEVNRRLLTKFELSIGDYSGPSQAVVIESPPSTIDGIIGWPALDNRITAISWDDATLKPIPSLPPELTGWMRFSLADHVPVAAIADGRAGNGLIYFDTGAGGGVELSPKGWDEWLAANPNSPMTLRSSWSPAHGGWAVSKLSWSGNLEVGALAFPRTTVEEGNSRWPNLTAVVELKALAHYDVMVDRINDHLYPKSRHIRPDFTRYNRLGATFCPSSLDEGELQMQAHVLDSSPGYCCGLRTGDILVAMDAVAVPELYRKTLTITVDDQPGFYAEAGTEYTVTVRRQGKQLDLRVVLEEILPVGNSF